MLLMSPVLAAPLLSAGARRAGAVDRHYDLQQRPAHGPERFTGMTKSS